MGENQLIISISREFGSGGHTIAAKIAERFELPLYNQNILLEIANHKSTDAEKLTKYDELPKNRLFSRTVRGYNNSPEENIANMQFDFLRAKAASGESFVIVGRCSETILKGFEGLSSFFILGDMEQKITRTAETKNISRAEAEKLIAYHDKKRKTYHNHYCDMKWGDSRNYDMSINSSRIGIDETTEIIIDYINRKCSR